MDGDLAAPSDDFLDPQGLALEFRRRRVEVADYNGDRFAGRRPRFGRLEPVILERQTAPSRRLRPRQLEPRRMEVMATKRPIAGSPMAIASFVETGNFITQLLNARRKPLEFLYLRELIALSHSAIFLRFALEFDFELEVGEIALEIREV